MKFGQKACLADAGSAAMIVARERGWTALWI